MNDFQDNFPLRIGRVHEAMGAAAYGFAAICCGLGGGDALWIAPDWRKERLNPVALAQFCDPDRLLIATGRGQMEILALGEEALRSGAVATLVFELDKPLDLTAGRRLQLAAEAGGGRGVAILSGEAGSNAAETRWRCAPVFDANGLTLQDWRIIKNKSGTLGAWRVRWDAEARCVIVVSEIGE